jgi:NAD(P)-dependent dehydrogenase (short-subunit alcohol dehydrogenase family)
LRLRGKIALVTGAGSGIGRASARRFAAEGARVALAEISPSGGDVEREIRDEGGEALFCQTDVTDEGSVARAVAALLSRWGRLDVLFNCAGGSRPDDGPVTEASPEVWDQALGVDLLGTARCCRHAIPAMLEQGAGSIVNTSSVVALKGTHGLHAYASAKGAVLALTRALAGQYGTRGIRANAICPGMVLTERIRARMGPIEAFLSAAPPAGVMDLRGHPFAVGQPEDIAAIALFLASDESRMIQGAVVCADGGLSAY